MCLKDNHVDRRAGGTCWVADLQLNLDFPCCHDAKKKQSELKWISTTIHINVKAVKPWSPTPNRWTSFPRGHVCPFPGQLIKHRWREVFREKMGIRKVKDGFLLLSASVLSLWRSPQATWHFNKMLNCTINTSAAGRTRRFVLSSARSKRGPSEVSVFWVDRDNSGLMGNPFTNVMVDLCRISSSSS